jgi:hypothetical protein
MKSPSCLLAESITIGYSSRIPRQTDIPLEFPGRRISIEFPADGYSRHLLSESVTILDFHQLLQLLCADFPRAALDACVHALPRALVGEGKAICGQLASAFEVRVSVRAFFCVFSLRILRPL